MRAMNIMKTIVCTTLLAACTVTTSPGDDVVVDVENNSSRSVSVESGSFYDIVGPGTSTTIFVDREDVTRTWRASSGPHTVEVRFPENYTDVLVIIHNNGIEVY